MKRAEILFGIVIVLVSIFIGFFARSLPGITTVERVLIGILVSILGLLGLLRYTVESYRESLRQQLEHSLHRFGSIISCLMSLTSIDETGFLGKRKDKILEHVPELRDSVSALSENLSIWASYSKKEGKEFTDSNDLWQIAFNLYLFEENRDITACKVATNIEIYTNFLFSCIKYFVEKYERHAAIFIITSLLPSDWYAWKGSSMDAEHVYRYREAIRNWINMKSTQGIKVQNFERYIVVQKSDNGDFRTLEDLKKESNESKDVLRQYINELHFEKLDEKDKLRQANYFMREDIGQDFSSNYKDILIFGKKETGKIIWTWAIECNLEPHFPVMFIRIYDPSKLSDPEVFAGSSVDIFTGSIRRHSVSLRDFLPKED